jgi:Zn-dependent protease with chaperone function
MRPAAAVLLCLAVAACGTTYAVPAGGPAAVPPAPGPVTVAGPARTAADFRRVLARVEPAGEAFCRAEAPDAPAAWCDFRVRLDTDPAAPPNAYQSEGRDGRPNVTLVATLLPEMQSDDEIAFVLAHEMSHHIAGHIPKQARQQMLGALVLGGLVAATGDPLTGAPATDQAIQRAMDIGAYVGARSYSQSYELEADTLGAFIAARAGYDPEQGARIFLRPALANPGGPPILASHPGSMQRQATVAGVAAEIRRQQALGLDPRPGHAG